MTAPATASKLLVLWDIDHTLITAGDFHTRLYRRAFEQAFGRAPETLINMSGRTDRSSMTITLERNGLEPTEARLRDFANALEETMRPMSELFLEMGERTGGAQAALASLAEDPAIVQTLVTGNLRPLALTKVGLFDLLTHLEPDVGGYGEDGLDRADLVRQARLRAGKRFGTEFPPSATVVIGDTPKDVAAAHSGGANIIAVATGKSSEDELREAGAEYTLPDLTDLDALHQALDEVWSPARTT